MGRSALAVDTLRRHHHLTMFALLLLLVPFVAAASSSACGHHHAGCVLPPASTEKFIFTNEPKTWHHQYMYRVPGIFELGCATYFQYPGEKPNVLNFIGNYTRVPKFPMEGITISHGNRLTDVYYGVWDCYLSGPLNLVFLNQDFAVVHRCLLGYDYAEILTTAKEPDEELMERIWKVVNNHTEVDRRKFMKCLR